MTGPPVEAEAVQTYGLRQYNKFYRWVPEPDITTYELALCMTIILSGLEMNLEIEKLIRSFPENVQRHFKGPI